MKPHDFSFEELKVGQTASFNRRFLEEDVRAFAALSRDENPLHVDEAYAKTTSFGRRIVHGLLVASACSFLVGMYLPGKRSLYLSQDLQFKLPVFVGDSLTTTGVITALSKSTRVVELTIEIRRKDVIVLAGVAKVKVL